MGEVRLIAAGPGQLPAWGNIATNAGGLRCAKYGVTRESGVALDVVLADGTLIHTGHRTLQGRCRLRPDRTVRGIGGNLWA